MCHTMPGPHTRLTRPHYGYSSHHRARPAHPSGGAPERLSYQEPSEGSDDLGHEFAGLGRVVPHLHAGGLEGLHLRGRGALAT